MSLTKELIQFRSGAPEEILDRMREIDGQRDGRSWINVQPWVDEEQMPKVSVLKHLFSSRGFVVPTGTWVPSHDGSKMPDVDELGITHPAGHNALGQLQDAGVTVPQGWRPIQDHTKRGIVLEVPRSESHQAIISWVISACVALAGDLPVDDRWVAGFLTQA